MGSFLKFSVLFLTIGLSSSFASDHPNLKIFNEFKHSVPHHWFHCTKNDDCIITAGPCGYPLVINNNSQKEEIRNKSREKTLPICLDFLPPRWPYRAICKDSLCEGEWSR